MTSAAGSSRCARGRGSGLFLLHPAGRTFTYDVSVFGDVENGGSLSVMFRWTTPTDGPLPEPEARLPRSLTARRIDSYGVELEVSNLSRTPDEASPTNTVRSNTGESVTFRPIGCRPEADRLLDGPDKEGTAAALGGDTFTYEVGLVLTRHVGTGTWPTDEIVGNEPSRWRRDFTPTLPAA